MTLQEKKQDIKDLFAGLRSASGIAELLDTAGKLFFELYNSFDTEQIKNLSGETDMIVQSVLIPLATSFGQARTADTEKEIDRVLQDILSLLDESSVYE